MTITLIQAFTNKYGHANAIRRALTMVPGPVHVVVGVHSDEEIARSVFT